jgi:site-specific DNA-methyltransferase (adenine-specific)
VSSSREPYYSDDLVTLYHGDCLEVTEWLSADVLVTDPPYGMAFVSNYGSGSRRPIANDRDAAVRDRTLQLWGNARPWLMFGTWRVARPSGTAQVLVWDKTDGVGPGMGDLDAAFGTSHEEIYLGGEWRKKTARRGSVIRTAYAMGNPSGLVARSGHPTPKPTDLMELLLAASSGVVADPFAGSGSTLVAAKALGRRAIGVELEERYCETAARRLAQDVLEFAQ